MIKIRDLIDQDAWVRVTYRDTKQRYHDWQERRFLRIPLAECYHFSCECRSSLLLITVAFNRADMIRHQLRLLPKYLTDSFCHIVLDNSSDSQSRKEIELACQEYEVGYVALPYNYRQHPSASHGMALNWAYHHLVRRSNCRYVGFLDHDIFPVRKHSILDQLALQPAYGRRDVRAEVAYLWPGFSFYRTELLKVRQVNFNPGVRQDTMVDTGGLISIEIDENTWTFAERHLSNMTEKNVSIAHTIEWLNVDGQDAWLHYIAAGHVSFAEKKEEAFRRLLALY